MKTNITRKIGKNRGKARLWIEGPALAEQGWNQGMPFTPYFHTGLILFEADPRGSRKVAGDAGRPILDTNTDKITEHLDAKIGDTVNIEITPESVRITLA